MNATHAVALMLFAGAALAGPGQPAITNRVLQLDGQTASMTVPSAPAFQSLSNALTLELRMRAASFSTQDKAVHCLLRKNLTPGEEDFFLRLRIVGATPVVEFTPGSRIPILQAPVLIQPGEWHHVAATYDGTNSSIFLDGALVRTDLRNGQMEIDDSALVIGKGDPNYSKGEYFDGALDDIRIWRVTRTPAEIKADSQKRLSGKESGLVASWDFDDGTATDRTGHCSADLQSPARVAVVSQLPAIASPPPADPARVRQQRLATVEELWRNLNEIYPALEYKGITNRSWIEPTLEKVRQAIKDEEFYDLLLELIASLKDTHTRILSYPRQPWRETPSVFLNEVEGKVAVIKADPGTGLTTGDVLIAINGQPVEKCLAAAIKQVCGSTERARVRGACDRLLRGAPGSTVTVTVESPQKGRRDITLRCERKDGFMAEPNLSSRPLDTSVGYVRIAGWGGADLVADFDRALELFKDCRGLIIDVRGNGGGLDQLADEVNGRLTDHPVMSSIDFWREAGTDRYRKTTGWVQPRGPWTYRGRVAVLIDEGCASACEHFVSGIEAMGNVLLVGLPTNGAGGGPTRVTLGDGTQVMISRALGIRANGVVFEGLGIPPHISLAPTLDQLRNGQDPVLERAKEWVLSNQPVPARIQPLSH
jgi:carboxyl-terminal processing protease